MPPSVLAGIDDTGTNIPFPLKFIISESATRFELKEDQLHHIFFHNRQRSTLSSLRMQLCWVWALYDPEES